MHPGAGANAAKQPDPIDRHIGRQLCLARRLHGISQQELAERLSVTFQQVQKYEKAVNRIAASRLHHAALVLDVPISFFFPIGDPEPQASGRGNASPREAAMDICMSPEATDLIISFAQISSSTLRRDVLQLLHSLAARAEGAVE